MTDAADRFTERLLERWDHIEPWEQVAAKGLAQAHQVELRKICQTTHDDFTRAAAEVLAFVRDRVEHVRMPRRD